MRDENNPCMSAVVTLTEFEVLKLEGHSSKSHIFGQMEIPQGWRSEGT